MYLGPHSTYPCWQSHAGSLLHSHGGREHSGTSVTHCKTKEHNKPNSFCEYIKIVVLFGHSKQFLYLYTLKKGDVEHLCSQIT